MFTKYWHKFSSLQYVLGAVTICFVLRDPLVIWLTFLHLHQMRMKMGLNIVDLIPLLLNPRKTTLMMQVLLTPPFHPVGSFTRVIEAQNRIRLRYHPKSKNKINILTRISIVTSTLLIFYQSTGNILKTFLYQITYQFSFIQAR